MPWLLCRPLTGPRALQPAHSGDKTEAIERKLELLEREEEMIKEEEAVRRQEGVAWWLLGTWARGPTEMESVQHASRCGSGESLCSNRTSRTDADSLPASCMHAMVPRCPHLSDTYCRIRATSDSQIAAEMPVTAGASDARSMAAAAAAAAVVREAAAAVVAEHLEGQSGAPQMYR